MWDAIEEALIVLPDEEDEAIDVLDVMDVLAQDSNEELA